MRKTLLVLLFIFSLSGITLGQSDTTPVSKADNKVIPQKLFSESKAYIPNKPSTSKKTIEKKNFISIAGKTSSNDDGIIKIDSSLVTIPVTVSDSIRELYVSDIKKEEVKVYEDGVEQEISYFGTFDEPFTVILILDTSPSTKYKIEEIQEAARAFVDQLKPQDRGRNNQIP